MNNKYLELLLRRTSFSEALLSHLWDSLDEIQRIELLLQFTFKQEAVPRDIQVKAVQDKSPIVRMLSARSTSFFFERDNPELHGKLLSDSSSFVKAAMNLSIDVADLLQLTHLERLGVIALSTSIDEEKLANFILNSLEKQLMTETEAASLVVEFVRNPRLKPIILGDGQYFEDGLLWHTNWSQFKAIWNLTTCTPPKVHHVIAYEYPLTTGQDDPIPEEMIYRMSEDALVAIVWRQHKPLLDLIEKNPEHFNERVHDAVRLASEADSTISSNVDEKDASSGSIDKLRTEIHSRLDDMENNIIKVLSKRRGLFG